MASDVIVNDPKTGSTGTMLVTTPIRAEPAPYPPFGSLSLIRYLRSNGIADVEFFHIDGARPSFDEALDHIIEYRPAVLGISAVVSTAYEYTKRLSLAVKAALPDTVVVVGGNLAASAEILLKRTGTDICVLGEGEIPFLSIVKRAETTRELGEYVDIPGLMILDAEGGLINTGYADPIDKSEINSIDWRDLEKAADINFYFREAHSTVNALQWIKYDPRSFEPHRIGKRMGSLTGSKGCVARCTFCHRWDKGIRYIPVDVIMKRLEEIIDKYDVGFLQMEDENFGTDKRWLREFCEKIKRYDILWRVGGMRVNCVDAEYINMMKDAGCLTISFGMETGSRKMLEIMEKKVRLEDNFNAMKWTVEAGLWTGVQLVVGMPGESPQTVDETIEFCKYAMTLSKTQNPNDTSINYAQALPGTPLYEYGRHRGLIGNGLDGEEEYLLQISDTDAHDEVNTANFTDYPRLTCQTWRSKITIGVNFAYVKKFGIDHYRRIVLDKGAASKLPAEDSGYFANPKRLIDTSDFTSNCAEQRNPTSAKSKDGIPGIYRLIGEGKFGLALICYPVLAYRLRRFLILLVIFNNLRRSSLKYTLGLVGEYLVHKFSSLVGQRRFFDYKSLRKVVNLNLGGRSQDAPEMDALRRGR